MSEGTGAPPPLGGAAATVVDPQGTVRDEAPPTVADVGGAAGPPQDDWDGVFPPALAARYRPLQELGSGAEAVVVLAEEVASGARMAVKVFHRRKLQLDPDFAARQERIPPGYVVPVRERGSSRSRSWEVMPYLPLGTVADLRAPGEPWPSEEVRAVVLGVAAALQRVHAEGLVHRDVKPSNLLLRSLQPMHVVLGDFGLARVLAESQEHGSHSRTPAYAAPESLTGLTVPGRDWWSLGITALELLLGRNPFALPGGRFPEDAVVLERVRTGRIDLSGVADERWLLLLRGLLTLDHTRRWGYDEVVAWGDGRSPAVHEISREDHEQPAKAKPLRPFVFNGEAHNSLASLARAVRDDPREAVRVLRGLARKAPAAADLLEWLRQAGVDVGELERSTSAERALAVLTTLIDPEGPPNFLGRDVSCDGLLALVQQANAEGWAEEATAAVLDLRRHGVLRVLGRLDGQEELARVDDAWQRRSSVAEELLRQLPSAASSGAAQRDRDRREGQLAGLLLVEVLSPGAAGPFRPSSAALRAGWFERLMQTTGDHERDVVAAVVARGVEQAAVQEVEAADAAAERRRIEEERIRAAREARRIEEEREQRQWAARRRAGQWDGPLAWIAVVFLLFLPLFPLALAAGVVSIWMSFRFDLPHHRRSWAAAIIGSALLVISIMAIPDMVSTSNELRNQTPSSSSTSTEFAP